MLNKYRWAWFGLLHLVPQPSNYFLHQKLSKHHHPCSHFSEKAVEELYL